MHELKPYMLHGAECTQCGVVWERLNEVKGECTKTSNFTLCCTVRTQIGSSIERNIYFGDELGELWKNVGKWGPKTALDARVSDLNNVRKIAEKCITSAYEGHENPWCPYCELRLGDHGKDHLMYFQYTPTEKRLRWFVVHSRCHPGLPLLQNVQKWFKSGTRRVFFVTHE